MNSRTPVEQGRIKALGALGRHPIPAGAVYTRGGKNWRFSTEIAFIPETVRDRPGNNPKHFFHSFRETDYSYAYTFL